MIVDIKKLGELKRKGPVWFIEKFLTFKGKPFTLYDFQKHIANTTDFMHDRVAICKGRQVGGSLLVAALIVYYVCCNPFSTCIIVSKTKDQASLISTYVREFIEQSALRELVNKTQTTVLDLYLVNKAKVITRSAGMVRGDTLRGHTIGGNGFLCYDESSFLSADCIRNTYFAAAGGCGIVHCSTPYRPVGAFYDAYHSKRFKRFHVPAKLSPRITAEDLAFWRDDMPASKYANEVDANFAQGEDAVFNPDDIDKAIDANLPLWPGPFKGDPDKNYIYSLDPARGGINGDKWTLTIGELDKDANLSIVAHHAWINDASEDRYGEVTNDPDDIITGILRYHKQQDFHCTKFYCDVTTNEYFAHTLEYKHLLPVVPVVWSTSKKEKIISHLETVLKTNRLKIPNADSIRRELLAYSYDWRRMLDHEERKLFLGGNDDDWVSSLAMISQSITTRKLSTIRDVIMWR